MPKSCQLCCWWVLLLSTNVVGFHFWKQSFKTIKFMEFSHVHVAPLQYFKSSWLRLWIFTGLWECVWFQTRYSTIITRFCNDIQCQWHRCIPTQILWSNESGDFVGWHGKPTAYYWFFKHTIFFHVFWWWSLGHMFCFVFIEYSRGSNISQPKIANVLTSIFDCFCQLTVQSIVRVGYVVCRFWIVFQWF